MGSRQCLPRITLFGAAALTAGVALSLLRAPQPAAALPTFAQALGVDCSTCHTMVPALNSYGRYVQATGFSALDPATLKKVLPIVVRESASMRSTGKLDRNLAADKWTVGNLSANAVGELSSAFSYRLEQSFYSNNVSGGTTGHFWVGYNKLLDGNGHLFVGKFDPPTVPAFSYWQDQSGFSAPSITVGQHTYNLGGQRWGVGFSYVPDASKLPFRAEIAYVGNSNPMFSSATFDSVNPYVSGGGGSDKAFQYKVAWARPDRPLEVGVYGASGTYVLAPGYASPIDNYTVIGAYAQRDPVKGMPGVLVFFQGTNDSNVGPGAAANHLTQDMTSVAWALELDESLFNGDVMVGVRPVEYVNGVQPSKAGPNILTTAKPHYGVIDIAARDPKFTPYLYAVFEAAMGAASNAPFGQPAWRIGLKWASPVMPAPK